MLAGSVRIECEHLFVYRSYGIADFEEVQRLARAGLSGYEISRQLGMPRATVQRWRSLARAPRSTPDRIPTIWRPADPASYAYLLGVYLGDGHIWQGGRTSSRLSVTLDLTYPQVIEEVAAAMQAADPTAAVRRYRRPGAALLTANGAIWTIAFPQHGLGRKHLRAIELSAWQREITHRHPKRLLRGLIHSDGCRCVNRFTTKLPSGRIAEYAYPRYFFSNLSADIRSIFCEHCELIGIRWTQSSSRNISIAHRDSVLIMDSFIGPKS